MNSCNRLCERVWMEVLEGRVLLSRTELIDISTLVERTGVGEAEFQFQANAGETYLFLDLEGVNGIHVLDGRGVEVADSNDDDTYQMRLLWTAPATAPYTLWLDGGEWGNADYDLVAGPFTDDYGSTIAGAAPYSLAESIQGKIEDPLDNDVFAFEASAGERWAFSLKEDSGVGMRIVDNQGNNVFDWIDGSEVMPYTGTYYIKINGDGDGYGDYSFSSRRVIDKEGDINNPTPLTIGTPIEGTIDYALDQDWFSFEGKAGTMYVFTATGEHSSHIITVRGSDGSPLFPYSDPYDAWQWGRGEWVVPADGRYFVAVNSGGMEEPYTLTSTIQRTADPAAAGVAIELNPGVVASASIGSPGDSQYFVVHAQEGATYTLSVPQMSLDEGLLIARLREGGAENDPDERDIRLKSVEADNYWYSWTARQAGTYYLFVRSIDPLATGTFELHVTEELDDHGNSAESATPIQLNVPVKGTWQYDGDQDWFELNVVAGEQYVFNLQGDGDGWGGFWSPRHNGPQPPRATLTIFDQHGHQLASGLGRTPANLKLDWTAAYGGRIYAVVDASEMRADYTLVASTVAADPQPARAIGIGELVQGSMSGQRDFVRLRFSPQVGKVYLLHAQIAEGDFRIVAANGDEETQRYVSLHDGCDHYGWKATAPGDYFVEMTAYDTTAYSVSVSEYVFSPCARPAKRKENDSDDSPPEYQGVPVVLSGVEDTRRFAFNARAGEAFVFYTDSTIVDQTMLSIYDANGTLLVKKEHMETDWTQLIWKAKEDATYFVVAGGYGAGKFNLQGYERTPDETPLELKKVSSGDTPQAPAPPQPVAGHQRTQLPLELADENDVRAFPFSAEAGRTYVFQTILGSLEDSTLTLRDSQGNIVDENDDVSDDDLSSSLQWTAEKEGTYFIVVGGFGGGSFRLSAFEGEGANRKVLKLSELAVANARLKFAADTSSDDEERDDEGDSLLNDDYDELDFSNDADWGFDI